MNVEELQVQSLTKDPANVRRHSDRNIEVIKGSLARFGQQKPIVVDGAGVVIAGNGTLEAARRLGWTHVQAVRSDLDGVDRTAYSIADNRSGDPEVGSEWDDAALVEVLKEMGDVDALAAGFSPDEIDDLARGLGGDSEAEQDDVPEVEDDAVTQPGDVWQCGDHRVVCGDCRKFDLDNVLTDPPYGVGYEYESWDDTNQEENDRLYAMINKCAGSVVYFCGSVNLMREIQRGPCKIAIWHKPWSMTHSGIGNGRHHWEPIVIRNIAKGSYLPSDVLVENTDREPGLRDEHSCPKPVKLLGLLIDGLFPDGVICDPFLGSGTTLIAAHQLGRRCYGIEIEPRYVDVCCKRWMALTGDSPVRESDGAKFSDLLETTNAQTVNA